MPLLRRRAQRLGQQGKLAGLKRHLAGAGTEQDSSCAEEVSKVEVVEQLVACREHVATQMDLELLSAVAQVDERCPAHWPQGGYPPCHGERLACAVAVGSACLDPLIEGYRLLVGVRAAVAGWIGVNTAFLEMTELLLP